MPNPKNDYARRMVKAVSHSGKTQGQISNEAGIKQPSLSALMSQPKRLSSANTKIAIACGVSPRWLETGKGRMVENSSHRAAETASIYDITKNKKSNTITVDHLAATPGMGAIVPADDRADEKISSIELTKNWIESELKNHTGYKNIKLINAVGSSMSPTFKNRDALFVDVGVKEIKLDAIYALRHDDSIWIKRVQRLPNGRFELISDNKKYKTVLISKKNVGKFEVIGLVLGVMNFKKLI